MKTNDLYKLVLTEHCMCPIGLVTGSRILLSGLNLDGSKVMHPAALVMVPHGSSCYISDYSRMDMKRKEV